MAYTSFSWSLSLALLYILYVNNWIMRYAKKFLSLDKKEPKYSQKAKYFFQGQTRNKKAKIELFGRKKAKLPTLDALYIKRAKPNGLSKYGKTTPLISM